MKIVICQYLHSISTVNIYLFIYLYLLDISNYLAPGCSYAQFLTAFGCDIPKGIFPYEWFDSYEKLSYPSLPSAQLSRTCKYLE